MDLPEWSQLYTQYGASAVSIALAALGYDGVPVDEVEAAEAVFQVRAYFDAGF